MRHIPNSLSFQNSNSLRRSIQPTTPPFICKKTPRTSFRNSMCVRLVFSRNQQSDDGGKWEDRERQGMIKMGRERVGKMPKQVHHISEEHLRDLLMIICSNSTSPAVSDRCSNIRRILDLNECVSLQTVEIHTHQGKLLANYRKDSQNGLTSSEYLK